MRPVNQRTKRMKLPRMRMPGRRKWRAIRPRTRKMKKTPRELVTTMYGKSLGLVNSVLEGVQVMKWMLQVAYHGVPRSICVCTIMNQAKMPRHVAEPESTTMSQMLSWISGQWYRGLFSRRTIAIVEEQNGKVACKDAVVLKVAVGVSRLDAEVCLTLRGCSIRLRECPSAQPIALRCRVVETGCDPSGASVRVDSRNVLIDLEVECDKDGQRIRRRWAQRSKTLALVGEMALWLLLCAMSNDAIRIDSPEYGAWM